MKKLLTTILDSVTIHHKGCDYKFAKINGAVSIPAAEQGKLSEEIALMLVLLSGARRIYIDKETYFSLREAVWFHLDSQQGGLKSSAKELFEDDEELLEASELHRKSFVPKPVNAKGKKS